MEATKPIVRCGDKACLVKTDCPLYLDPQSPERRLIAHSLRQNWESHNIPCKARHTNRLLHSLGLIEPDPAQPTEAGPTPTGDAHATP